MPHCSPLLFPQRFWDGLRSGTVTLAFRRWKQPRLKPGGTLQTPRGLLAIDALDRIEPSDVTDEDARAAGYADRHELFANLRPDGDLYRVRLHRLGDDPRIELRLRTDLDEAEFAELMRVLGRLASRGRRWNSSTNTSAPSARTSLRTLGSRGCGSSSASVV